LKVVSVQPYKTVLGDIVKMRTTSIPVILCFLILSVFVSVVMAHKLYKPVETMLRGSKPILNRERRRQLGRMSLSLYPMYTTIWFINCTWLRMNAISKKRLSATTI
jgi:hypothetical protein